MGVHDHAMGIYDLVVEGGALEVGGENFEQVAGGVCCTLADGAQC